MAVQLTAGQNNGQFIKAKKLFKDIIKENKIKKIDPAQSTERLEKISEMFLNARAYDDAFLSAKCIPSDRVRDNALLKLIQVLIATGDMQDYRLAVSASDACVTGTGRDQALKLVLNRLIF